MPPYNGSGTFTPYTPGNPVIPGTTISSTAFNSTQSDIAAGLTNAVTRDGQSPPTANLPMGGRKHTGLAAGTVAGDSLRWEQLFNQGVEQDIASAATVDVGALNTTIARITGTITITSFGTNYNGPRFVRFAGILTLTHNATTLILPGAANITTAAGDRAILTPVGNPSNGWQVLAYQRADGTALAGGVLPGSISASGLTMDADRFLARSTASTGAIEQKTAAEIRAMLGISLDQLAQPGDMKAFTGTSAPSGWLAMPTSATNISRTTYASLFAAIGTTWGAGDGSTTFGCPYCPANHVPVQASGNVGTTTAGAVLAHTHPIVVWGNNTTAGGEVHRGTGSAMASTTTESTGGAANLAAGVRVLWCVKL